MRQLCIQQEINGNLASVGNDLACQCVVGIKWREKGKGKGRGEEKSGGLGREWAQ